MQQQHDWFLRFLGLLDNAIEITLSCAVIGMTLLLAVTIAQTYGWHYLLSLLVPFVG